ncbi:MAG TPA: hypothetical protein VFQ30_05135 [Ktedonobacteraceae bacterium]|nr:hypothetical protein [Ktedonobacteraceae bacterium]
MSEIRDYQVDHLLLLVGSNPLPNAVAGKLLTVQGGKISLIHSKDGSDLAGRLAAWFRNAGYVDIGLKQVEESDAASVRREVSRAIEEYEQAYTETNQTHTARVGLNYTGGTKVMSTHAYRTLEQWASVHKREAVFSYLDARTLHIRFEQITGWPPISFYVGLELDMSIRDLLKLHNWELTKEPITVPGLPESAAALLAIHSNAANARIWTEWLHNDLFPIARKRVAIRPPFWVFQSGKELQGQYNVEQPAPNDQWKSKSKLRGQAISWPNLPVLRETMSKELGQGGAENLDLTTATGLNRCKDEVEFCKWLSGIWLEYAVLSALQHCAQELHLNDYCMDLRPRVLDSEEKGELFQFDVVAIRGYQLFAFSCTTGSAKENGGRARLKHRLFEAYVRTRQMGGDEACVALVCCMNQEEADRLEDEMRRDISPEGRIRVFGREHLVNLTGHIENWVREQSKEE